MRCFVIYLSLIKLVIGCWGEKCEISQTSVIINNIINKPISNFCSGEIIFDEDFNKLDKSVWKLENSMGIGGGSKEFQWYVNSEENAYVEDGILHIKPTLTSDIYGEEFLYNGHVVIPDDECTSAIFDGCDKKANLSDIINPIRSVRMNTFNSFSFKYGVMEVKAKTPSGDWLFPALWMNPRYSVSFEDEN